MTFMQIFTLNVILNGDIVSSMQIFHFIKLQILKNLKQNSAKDDDEQHTLLVQTLTQFLSPYSCNSSRLGIFAH